jgi:hypothetical protein
MKNLKQYYFLKIKIMFQQLKNFFSLFNSVLPSVLAVVNILFISKMCNTIIAQNLIIIQSIAALKQETAVKTVQMPSDTIINSTELNILNAIAPYAFYIGTITVFGILLYFHFTSGNSGSAPTFPPIDAKRLEDAIVSKVEEKSSQIITTITEKVNESASYNRFVQASFDYILENVSRVSEKVEISNTNISDIKNTLVEIKQDCLQNDTDLDSGIKLTQKVVDNTVRAVNKNFDQILELQKQNKANAGNIIVLRHDIQSTQVTKDFGVQLNQKMNSLSEKLDNSIKNEDSVRTMANLMSNVVKGTKENHKDNLVIQDIIKTNSDILKANSSEIQALKNTQESVLKNQADLTDQFAELKQLVIDSLSSNC